MLLSRLHRSVAQTALRLLGVLLTSCLASDDPEEIARLQLPLDAYCRVTVTGVGTLDVEEDYIPHVVNCENGGASYEALRAQAVAARSYMFYKLESSGSIADGTSDQVYSCGREPREEVYQAVRSTSGQVIMYDGVVICSFYVAGAIPSADSCVAVDSDRDPTNTERYVTYNWGRSGDGITQSRLGWVNPGNIYNRGCMSQNGSDCLSDNDWTYDDILRFYYGDDITLETTVGSCVEPPEDPDDDEDGVPNSEDNCVDDANPGQEDFDGDGDGDACDADDDGDGVDDQDDCAPLDPEISPGAEEICNEIDDDCDDLIDEDEVCGSTDGDGDTDVDGDIDSDSDVDSDADGDVDADGDLDSSGFDPAWRPPPMHGGCSTSGAPSRGLLQKITASLL